MVECIPNPPPYTGSRNSSSHAFEINSDHVSAAGREVLHMLLCRSHPGCTAEQDLLFAAVQPSFAIFSLQSILGK